MKNLKNILNPYNLITVLGGTALLIAGEKLPLLWIIGCILLPPVTLAVLHRLPNKRAPIVVCGLLAICLLGAPNLGTGALLFVLWYGAAAVARLFTRRTPDLVSIVLYGGSLFGALFCFAFCWAVRDYYGVWDIRGVFTALENLFLNAADGLEQMCRMIYRDAQLQEMLETVELLRASTEAMAYKLIAFVLSIVCLQFLLTIKGAGFLTRKDQYPLRTLPLWMFNVPRELVYGYLITYVISFFMLMSDYYYALDVALTLMGYLFVLTGIGVVDGKLIKQTPALRNLVKIVLLLAAVLGEGLAGGIIYTLLSLSGIFMSLRRQVIITRKGSDHRE